MVMATALPPLFVLFLGIPVPHTEVGHLPPISTLGSATGGAQGRRSGHPAGCGAEGAGAGTLVPVPRPDLGERLQQPIETARKRRGKHAEAIAVERADVVDDLLDQRL